MEEEKQFATSEDVQKWLSDHRKVPSVVAAKVAQTLFEVGYTYPSSLLNIQRDDLNLPQIIRPHRNVLFNKLQQQPQPQQQEASNFQSEQQANGEKCFRFGLCIYC